MDLSEIIALAKRASTLDTQYIVEAKQSPNAEPEIVVRRIVELTGIERCYGAGCERPLSEAIERMEREVAVQEGKRRRERHNGEHAGIDRADIVEYVAGYEKMHSGEGPTLLELSARFGLNGRGGAKYHIDKLVEQHVVRMYRDPFTDARRYKVVKKK